MTEFVTLAQLGSSVC